MHNNLVLGTLSPSESHDTTGKIRLSVKLVSQPDVIRSGVSITCKRIEILKKIRSYVVEFRKAFLHLKDVEVRGCDLPVESDGGSVA